MVNKAACGVYMPGRFFGDDDRHCRAAAVVEVGGRRFCQRHAKVEQAKVMRQHLNVFADDFHEQTYYQRDLLLAWLTKSFDLMPVEQAVLRRLPLDQLIVIRGILVRNKE